MSFSIGPVMGKRDAVIRAVQEAKVYDQQGEAAKAFIVAELEQVPPEKVCIARAWGHSDYSIRSVTIEVNQFGTNPPTLVE